MLTSLTVGAITYTDFVTPSGFVVNGFTSPTVDITSRIFDIPGAFVITDPDYEAQMLANVFSNAELNAYQQVDDLFGAPGFFEFQYATPVEPSPELFLLITERNGNNTQFVEAFDTDGNSLGTVTIDAGTPDYTSTGREVGFGQDAFLAVVPLDEFAVVGNPNIRIERFRLSFEQGARDGGDGVFFVFGSVTPPNPELTLTKSVASVADTNGNGLLGDVGDTITYDFAVENTGDVSLAGISITDMLLGLTDEPVTPEDLAPGDTAVLTGQTFEITQAIFGAGEVENTATVSGAPVATDGSGNPDPTTPILDGGVPLPDATDTSDTGTEPDLDAGGNPIVVVDPGNEDTNGTPGDDGDEPTILTLPTPMPELTLTKSVASVADTNSNGVLGDAGDIITYNFAVENTGDTSLAGVSITDTLLGLTDVAVTPADLAPGDTAVLTGQPYAITPENVAAGEVENTATTAGAPVATDASGDPDPTTPILDGGVPLPDATDTSDTGTEPTINPDGTPIVVVDPGNEDTNGTPGDDGDEPTIVFLIASQPELTLTKSVSSVADTNGNGVIGDAGDTITYDFEVENTGNTSLAGVGITDPLLGLTNVAVTPVNLAPGDTAVLTGQTYVITPADVVAGQVENTATAAGAPVATDASGDPDPLTPLVDGLGDPLPDATDTSDTGSEPAFNPDGTPIVVVDPGNEDTNGTPGDDGDEPTILFLAVPGVTGDLIVSKVAAVSVVRLGDAVPYTIEVTNTSTNLIGPLEIRDVLPVGLVYVEGSALLNGAAASALGTGRNLTVTGISLPPSGTATLTYVARVTSLAPIGELTNLATLIDSVSGAPAAPPTRATVRRVIEPVFDCSDVIGKVFDDKDGDGYQDGPYRENGITNQEYLSTSGPSAVVIQEDLEPGLAAVRVVTPRGVVITTDEYGRFHVPCAELPRSIGSNFTLKLDERSLPTGYRLTTENPRTIRLTAGKVAKLNFGASLGRVVKIDLSARAFEGVAPTSALEQGLQSLLRPMEDPVSILRISYYQSESENSKNVRKRLDAVERKVRRYWNDRGRYKLTIERTIRRQR
ncbi:MAG: hypothetical protein AAFV74_18130 [Pseudomonadota bacterium]